MISQLKKYELVESFNDMDEFKKWISRLNQTQIDNFLSLNIDLKEVREVRHLLINSDLLSCKDYKKRVDAISTLKKW